ncbi:chaperonin CPN60-2, mitochondrial [Trifolium repens]|nr:chaperonin CPN60-2, mitochondrial [Trifolium repens]
MNQVRKKLSDIITDLHQLVAPFGKELDDPLTIIYEKKISSINAIVEVLELALKAYFTFFTPFFIYCIESVSQSSKSASILQGTDSISKFLIYCKISGCLREIRLGYIAYRFPYYLAFPE